MFVPPDGTLPALLDALLPEASDAGGGRPYPSASAAGVDREVAALVATLPRGEQAEFAALLRAVDSRLINLLLSGRPVRFSRLGPPEREAYLRRWSRSPLALPRRGFHALKRLAVGVYFSGPLDGAPHPLWERIRYEPPAAPEEVPGALAGLWPVRPDREVEESADVCVVGSGAGGSVIAARAAVAGYRVVVLESGPWVPGLRYPRGEREAREQLFLGQGVLTTRDHAIGILAGGTVGGGTSINWMTCLPPRPEARAEWARDGGMIGSDGPSFDLAYRAVAERLHVSTAESDVNPSNEALRRGCEALGYRRGVDWDVIPRNAVGCRSRCGFCAFGCPYAARQSSLTTFLADAMRAGARLYASTSAERVEVAGGRATGVVATFREGTRTHRVHIRARAVVAAAGAIETPALLLRSDLTGPGIGRGLRLDPTVPLAGEFPFPVRPWSGPPQTIGVYRFQRADPGAHGPWIEVAPAHPGLAAIALPWEGAADFRAQLERLERVATPIVLVRDTVEGRVTIDRDGRPVLDYRLGRADRAHLVLGMIETARLLRAAGATRISSLHTPRVEVGNGADPVPAPEVERFADEVRRRGIRENGIALFSAHAMGSARAGLDPRRSAARPSGELHGVEGLWIGDGSLLPSAPGANPMMSILALAWRTSEALLARLGERAGEARRPEPTPREVLYR